MIKQITRCFLTLLLLLALLTGCSAGTEENNEYVWKEGPLRGSNWINGLTVKTVFDIPIETIKESDDLELTIYYRPYDSQHFIYDWQPTKCEIIAVTRDENRKDIEGTALFINRMENIYRKDYVKPDFSTSHYLKQEVTIPSEMFVGDKGSIIFRFTFESFNVTEVESELFEIERFPIETRGGAALFFIRFEDEIKLFTKYTDYEAEIEKAEQQNGI